MIEIFVALGLLLAVLVPILNGSFSMNKASSSINQAERSDVLLTSFGESLKSLPYVPCTLLDGSDYQTSFDTSETSLSSSTQKLVQSGPAVLTVGVVTYDASSDCVAGYDSGTQTIQLSASTGGKVRTGTIVKRNPAPSARNALVKITATPQSSPGDSQQAFSMSAVGSLGPSDPSDPTKRLPIYQYQWACDDGYPVNFSGQSGSNTVFWGGHTLVNGDTVAFPNISWPAGISPMTSVIANTKYFVVNAIPNNFQVSDTFGGPPIAFVDAAGVAVNSSGTSVKGAELQIYTVSAADDPSVVCTYTAGASAITKTVRLTITSGGVTTTGTRLTQLPGTGLVNFITVPAASIVRPPPIAGITRLPAGDVPSGTSVSFVSSGPDPSATVVRWFWNFGDLASGAANDVTCVSFPGIVPACKDQAHVFSVAGTFTVTLSVTDVYNVSSQAVAAVRVIPLGIPTPTAAFTWDFGAGTTANSPTAVAPQLLRFFGANSHANGVAGGNVATNGITNYSWNVNGNTLSGSSPSWTFATPCPPVGLCSITLTVTSSNGATNSVTKTISVTSVVPPVNIQLTGYQVDLPFIRNGNFSFAWTNVPRSPGDTITYQVRVYTQSFICSSFFGDQTQSVASNGGAGVPQSFVFRVSSRPFRGFNGACLWSTFHYLIRSHRVSATGVISDSPWSTDTSKFLS